MYRTFTNKLLVVSLMLASAGILTCAGSLLSVLLPAASMMAFLAWMGAALAAVTLIVVAFGWACDKVDQKYPAEMHYETYGSPARLVTSARGGHVLKSLDPEPRNDEPTPAHGLQEYPISMRGTIRVTRVRLAHGWHGQ